MLGISKLSKVASSLALLNSSRPTRMPVTPLRSLQLHVDILRKQLRSLQIGFSLLCFSNRGIPFQRIQSGLRGIDWWQLFALVQRPVQLQTRRCCSTFSKSCSETPPFIDARVT